jgi:ABC-type nitrate/sulfonate/bicarbonate transport system substrate-binding protein
VQRMANIGYLVAATIAFLGNTANAATEDQLKIVIDQRGPWDLAAPELGQQAGIFKKHGIVLDLTYSEAEKEAVIAGNADIGVGIDLMEVLRAYATKGAPVRIIGANMTGSVNYWYVATSSPIKTVKDISGGTIAYSKSGESNQYDVFDLMDQYRLKARPVLTGGEAATFNQVISGKIDVGWARAPFGLDAVEHDQIRIVAKSKDVSKIRVKTSTVMIANADMVASRKEVLTRFLQAYRETIDWMYADDAALKAYAEFAGVSEGIARRLREEFFKKEMLSTDNIVGLSGTLKDAVRLKYIVVPLSKKQLSELIQITSPAKASSWFRIFSP